MEISIICIVITILTSLVVHVEGAKNIDSCAYCKFMVATFEKGLQKTENQHFAGGNTDWEERKLGRFKTSETRFVEIMEYVCKKNHLDDSSEFDSLKDLQFKCNHLAEDHEELLESWFFKRQEGNPDLYKFICIEEARKCCPADHYGPNCAPCPGALKGKACFGKGNCDGSGTREGTGKCECDTGYAGVRCSNCAAHFFSIHQNETALECEACFDGCAGSCNSTGPKGCSSCRSGYKHDENEGCVDVDECAVEISPCDKDHEQCINTQGHYNCECIDGYRRNFDTDECEIDVHATPYDGFWRPDRMLRVIAIGGLTSVAGFVLAFHRSTIALVALGIASTVAFVIERRFDESLIPDEAKRVLNRLF